MWTKEEKAADQELFRTMVKERLRVVFQGSHAELARSTDRESDSTEVGRFVNGRGPNIGPVPAKRWAQALRIPRIDMPPSLCWPASPEEEAREMLAPYLSEISRMERLPYYEVLRSMREMTGRPPKLTDVYVRPEYRKQSETSKARGGTLPQLRQKLEDALNNSQHALLQGSPASGKSSVVAKLTLDLAEALQEGPTEFNWVPVPVNAREFMSKFDQARRQGLAGALSVVVGDRFRVDLPSDLFENPPPYEGGKWLLIFDGLDEIVEEATRYRLIDEINRSVEASSRYKFLVTSRPMKEVDKLHDEDFSRFMLLPFGKEQTTEFIQNWFAAVATEEHAEEMADGFRSWLDTGRIGDIATSPGMLTIAAIVYQHSGGELPRNRIELYEAYTNIMLVERINQPEGIVYSFRNAFTKGHDQGEAGRSLIGGLFAMQEALFQEAAHRLQDHTELDFVALAVKMANEAPWFSSIPQEFQANPGKMMKSWVEDLLRASGIVQESSPGQFTFVHNTIREYFAAAWLEKNIKDDKKRRAQVRRWSEARSREIVLFFLSKTSGTPEGSAQASSDLRRILASGPRGVHFAGTALAEGVRVDDATADAIISGVIIRAKNWNLCREILQPSEFRSPDVTEILRMLIHNSKVREALMQYLRKGGNDCPKSLQAMFDFAEEIADTDELEYLASFGSSLWVRVGAITGLLRLGETTRALPLVRAAVPRLGEQYGIDVVLAVYAAGAGQELLWIADCQPASRVARLAALLFLTDQEMPEVERSKRIESLVPRIDNWKPITGDVLDRLAENGALEKLLLSKPFPLEEGLRFCGALIDTGHDDKTIDYLEDALLVSKPEERASIVKLLARALPASAFLPKLQKLCRATRRSNPVGFLELADLCGSLGDTSFLTEVVENEENSVSDRCRAAVAIQRMEPTSEKLALEMLKSLAPKVTSDRAWQDVLSAAIAIDPSKEAITEVLSWIAQADKVGPEVFEPLYEARLSWALSSVAADPDISRDSRLYAIRALGGLGEGEELYTLVFDPSIDFELRLSSIVALSKLAWDEEVREAAISLLDAASYEEELSILREYEALGIEDIAASSLTALRDNTCASSKTRLDAAKILAGKPWKLSAQTDFVNWLLQGRHQADFLADGLSWIADRSKSDPEGVFNKSVGAQAMEKTIDLLCDVRVAAPIRQQMLSDLMNRYSKVPPPNEAVRAIVSLSSTIDENQLRYLHQHGKNADSVVCLLAKWSELEMSTLDRIRLAKVAFETGNVDVALHQIESITLNDLASEHILSFANCLRDCKREAEAVAILRRYTEDSAVSEQLRYNFVATLFEWKAISDNAAYDLVAVIAADAESSASRIAMAHLNLSLAGALPKDPAVLLDALSKEDLGFEYCLLICEILLKLDKRAPVHSFLKSALHSERLDRSLPACVFLIKHMSDTVALETVRIALSAFGNFQTSHLVAICYGAGELSDGQAIREEVIAFFSYCNTSEASIRSFAKELALQGMTDLPTSFAPWLQDTDRNELINEWQLPPEAADAFLAASMSKAH